MQIEMDCSKNKNLRPIVKQLKFLGFRQDLILTPLDYFQVIYYDREADILWRLNVKEGVLLWESQASFDLSKVVELYKTNFLIINHLTHKANGADTIEEFLELLSPTVNRWRNEMPNEMQEIQKRIEKLERDE